MNDLRFAFRQLLKNPGFTAVAVLTLALGIGACTAIFSVVNSVLLRPMPYPEQDRLVVLKEDKLPELTDFAVAPGNYFSWHDQATCFENLAAEMTGNYNLTGLGEPLRLNVRFLTGNFLTTLRVRPMLGRDIRPGEEVAGKDKVVLLSHGFWLRQFGAAEDVIGKALQLDGNPFTVIGVLPPSFRPESRTDVYVPAVFGEDGRQNHGAHFLEVTGRLKPGVTLDAATRELAIIAGRLSNEFPITNKGWGIHIAPVLEALVGPSRRLLWSLLGAVGFLLLIACANVANLFLARASARTGEMSVRAALGAGHARIIRQLLTESLLLSACGGLLALFVAKGGVALLIAFAPADLPRVAEITVDGRAFALTCALALVTGIGFGIAPAYQAARVDPGEALKSSGRRSGAGRRGIGFRDSLVVVEVAIALPLLVGAGLLFRSATELRQVRPGFQPDGAVAVTLSLADNRYGKDSQKADFATQVAARLAALPGVQSVGAAAVLPFSGDDFNLRFNIAGRPPVDPAIRQGTLYYPVTPDYFRAMGIPLVRGRYFDSHDVAGGRRVAIINEALAKRFFPNEDPIGQRINLSNGPESFREIVGIVGDVKHYRLDDMGEITLQTYEPFAQQPYGFMTFVVRAAAAVSGMTTEIRKAVAAVDRDQPVASVRPLTELIAASFARQRFATLLFGVFAGAALLLAALGIYGVMAYSVTQRTGAIGIRMALGARRFDVLKLVFRQGGRLVGIGLAAGLLGALVLTRFIASMLFGVSAHDPWTFAAIGVLLAAVAAIACFLPARRAARVDPMVALRME